MAVYGIAYAQTQFLWSFYLQQMHQFATLTEVNQVSPCLTIFHKVVQAQQNRVKSGHVLPSVIMYN